METTKLQELYRQSQTIHDKLFALENRISKLRRRGRRCVKMQDEYFTLLDELRGMDAQTTMLECGASSFNG